MRGNVELPVLHLVRQILLFHGMVREIVRVKVSLPVPELLRDKLHFNPNLMNVAGSAGLMALTFIAVTYIAVGSYNPFIYFNF